MRFKQLTIISDTAIYYKDGKYYGFAPVVNELEHIESYFDKIIWIGYNRLDRIGDKSLKAIESTKTKIVLLKPTGGKSIIDKLKIIIQYPIMIFTLLKYCYNAQVIHSRGPSHPAFISIVLSYFFPKKIWWHKFAGSWDEKTLPSFYKIQKKPLERAKHIKVTVNGFWDNQPSHCYSFENPCLISENIQDGLKSILSKKYAAPFEFTFIGRINEDKGVSRIIDSLLALDSKLIKRMNFVGVGNLSAYKSKLKPIEDKIVFHGFKSQSEIFDILKQTHFLLLPSNSEGFPKVVAEGACYGAIPIVSNVGSISHYINDTNGFVWDINNDQIKYQEIVNKAISTHPEKLYNIAQEANKFSVLFTFDNFKSKLDKHVFS